MGVLAHPVTSEFPIGSMYGIFTYIYHKSTIHGSVNISVPWIRPMGLSFFIAHNSMSSPFLCFPNRPNLHKNKTSWNCRCPRWNMQGALPLQPMCSLEAPRFQPGRSLVLPRCSMGWEKIHLAVIFPLGHGRRPAISYTERFFMYR